jgi:hypothetical protein
VSELDLESYVSNTVRDAVTNYLSNANLEQLAAASLATEINNSVTQIARTALSNILQSRDIQQEIDTWIHNTVAEQLLSSAKSAIVGKANSLNLEQLAADVLAGVVGDQTVLMNFPTASISPVSIDWSRARIPAEAISSGKLKSFASPGITDASTDTQIMLSDDGAVIKNLLVEQTAFIDNLSTEKHLEINGRLSLGEQARLVISEIAAETSGKLNQSDTVDITGKTVVHSGKLILSADTLGPSVVHSNIRKLGNLLELNVSGDSFLGDVMIVSASGKVGINTEEVPGALSVWDDDAEFSLVKTRSRNMFAGSTRNTQITLGSNNQDQIILKTDGGMEFNGKIRWSGRLFSIATTVPEHTGEPGEIVIVSDDIYSCQGGNRWKKIA